MSDEALERNGRSAAFMAGRNDSRCEAPATKSWRCWLPFPGPMRSRSHLGDAEDRYPLLHFFRPDPVPNSDAGSLTIDSRRYVGVIEK